MCCALGNPTPLVGHGVTDSLRLAGISRHFLVQPAGLEAFSLFFQPWRDPSLWLNKCLKYQPLLPVLDDQQTRLGYPSASRAFFLFLLWQGFYLSFNVCSKLLRDTEAAAQSLMDLNSQVHVAQFCPQVPSHGNSVNC